MNEDPQLTNFLRKHRSIAPPESSALEDTLMLVLEPLPVKKKRRISRKWWRYLEFGISSIVTGIMGVTIHTLMNPAPPDIANIHQLDRYLEAHWHRLGLHSVDINDDNMAELEAYLLQSDDDIEDI
jgi:hypothetical protein